MQTSISKPLRASKSRTDGATRRAEIEAWARDLGFSAFGVAPAGPGPERDSLKEFLARGFHGDMAWMATHAVRRGNPNALWPEARSIIMLAADYTPQQPPGDVLRTPERGAISVYAQSADYHKVMKKRLKRLASDIAHRLGGEVKLFVDTAPVMEKPLAMRAGIGWQGKHSNLVIARFWLLALSWRDLYHPRFACGRSGTGCLR